MISRNLYWGTSSSLKVAGEFIVVAKVMQGAFVASVLNADIGTRCKQGSADIQQTGKHISMLLFFPRTDGAEAASFPHSIPPLGLMILPLWLLANFERSTKIFCPLNGSHFSEFFQQVFCHFQLNPKYSGNSIKEKCRC